MVNITLVENGNIVRDKYNKILYKKSCLSCNSELIGYADVKFCKQCRDKHLFYKVTCLECSKVYYAQNKNKYCSIDCSTKAHTVMPDEQGRLICSRCETYKEPQKFHKDSRNKYRLFRNHICTVCEYERQKAKHRNNHSVSSYLKQILRRAKKALKSRSNNKRFLSFEIDLDYLIQLYNNQEGRCVISGIPMTIFIQTGRVDTNVSIDRIDNNKGYIKGNIQLVCFRINMMRNNLEMSNLLYYCKQILNNNERSKIINGIPEGQSLQERTFHNN